MRRELSDASTRVIVEVTALWEELHQLLLQLAQPDLIRAAWLWGQPSCDAALKLEMAAVLKRDVLSLQTTYSLQAVPDVQVLSPKNGRSVALCPAHQDAVCGTAWHRSVPYQSARHISMHSHYMRAVADAEAALAHAHATSRRERLCNDALSSWEASTALVDVCAPLTTFAHLLNGVGSLSNGIGLQERVQQIDVGRPTDEVAIVH